MLYLINCSSRGQNTEGVCADEVQRAGVSRRVLLKWGEYTFNVTSQATYQLCFIEGFTFAGFRFIKRFLQKFYYRSSIYCCPFTPFSVME